jgi:RimJ/RimL family protein N-acetyltransferase
MTVTEQVVDLPFPIAPPLPHVREYREADAEAVARMWRGSASAWPGGGPGGGEHSTAARVRQEQRDLNTLATFIAWAPDPEGGPERAVGYCSLFEQPSDASAAYVGILSAHPDWHGQGFGRDLLKAALARTVAAGYTRLDLGTWAGNLKAVPLYKKSGYFWVPDTSVRMQNYLPLIFRLPPAQAFFREADWYRDFRRDLAVRPDEEKRGKQEVYTYTWERDSRRLQVVIDRASRGVIALETEGFAVSTTIDDPRLPVGGQREVRWRVENRGSEPLPVSLLAEGEDSVRCTLQSSVTVADVEAWAAPVTAEQPPTTPPVGRPTNRVRSTVVVAGQAIPLNLGTEVVQPVQVTFDATRLSRRWLTPGTSHRFSVAATNSLDEAVRGTLRLAAPGAVSLDRTVFDFDLGPRRSASWLVEARPEAPGLHALRAEATVTLRTGGQDGAELRTRVFEQSLPCGEPGDVFVEQTGDRVWIATDRHTVGFSLSPARDWQVGFDVNDRASGERLLSHSASLGPPFVPSVFAASTWTPRVEREGGSVTVTLAANPAPLPGLTFERAVRVSPSGVLRVVYRLINAGAGERNLQVGAGTSVRLGMVSGTRVAVPLASGLVVEDSDRFPDWEEPEQGRPERYAETWMAEFGGGFVGATLWRGAKEVFASWDSPSLIFDLGTIPPGGQAETPPVYLYAGQGDWKTARTLWRQLVGPTTGAAGPSEDAEPEAHPAHRLRLERFAFDTATVETRLLLESERAETMSGRASVEVGGGDQGVGARAGWPGGEEVAAGPVEGLRLGAPQAVPVRLTLPDRPAALPATLVFDHEREREVVETAVVRAGLAGTPVTLSDEADGRVRLENGRLRLTFAPVPLARLVELSVRDAGGEWINQLHVADPGPDTFVWFNPWYGGIHPMLIPGRGRSYPGPLREETFTWEPAEVAGAQGLPWKGITASTLAASRQLAGLHLSVSYLTTGGSNLLAVVERLENRSEARATGVVYLSTFLQPGGDRRGATLYFEQDGRLRHRKRVHGGSWGSAGAWCAIVPPAGPAVAVVRGSPAGSIAPRDMGLEGVHPDVHRDFDLAPGEALELVSYLVLAADLDEARRYRVLAGAGLV